MRRKFTLALMLASALLAVVRPSVVHAHSQAVQISVGRNGFNDSVLYEIDIEAGHEVTGAARNGSKAEVLKSAGARATVVDLFDRDAVILASAGHDVLINLATHIPPMREAAKSSAWTENDRIRTTLVPRSVTGARERLERVAQWAALALGSETAVTVV